LTILFLWLGLSVVVGIAAGNRGRNGFGWFLLALIISPLLAGLAVLAAANLRTETDPRQSRTCPFCAEWVRLEAVVCKHCGRDLPAAPELPVRSVRDARRQNAAAVITIFVVLIAAIVWGLWPATRERTDAPESSSLSALPAAPPPAPAAATGKAPLPKPKPKDGPGAPLPLLPR
jgi:cbb3-type cytochrome oxidase subunit 3